MTTLDEPLQYLIYVPKCPPATKSQVKRITYGLHYAAKYYLLENTKGKYRRGDKRQWITRCASAVLNVPEHHVKLYFTATRYHIHIKENGEFIKVGTGSLSRRAFGRPTFIKSYRPVIDEWNVNKLRYQPAWTIPGHELRKILFKLHTLKRMHCSPIKDMDYACTCDYPPWALRTLHTRMARILGVSVRVIDREKGPDASTILDQAFADFKRNIPDYRSADRDLLNEYCLTRNLHRIDNMLMTPMATAVKAAEHAKAMHIKAMEVSHEVSSARTMSGLFS